MRRSASTLLFTLAVLAVPGVVVLAQSKEPVKIGFSMEFSPGRSSFSVGLTK